MKAAFRQYLEDLEDDKVKPESYYLELEYDNINKAYDDGIRDALEENLPETDYFATFYLE
jgi:hypothetical protein